jgi:uncharacterized protein YqgC (DUF456 family)
MDIILLISGVILIIIGIIGCIIPVVPGPLVSCIGLALLHLTSKVDLSTFMLSFVATITIIVTLLDYIIPHVGTKAAGGTKWGMRGCAIGLIIGMFTGITGVFILPFLGAFVGEMLYFVKNNNKLEISKSLKAALGSFIGLIFGTILKLYVSCFVAFLFVKETIINFF